MARYRGFKGTLLQWCYRNRKADCLLMGLLQAVNELNQMLSWRKRLCLKENNKKTKNIYKKRVDFSTLFHYNSNHVEKIINRARLAQLAEHLTLNQGVQGSNP